jgi:hypothetical protein
MRLYDVEQAAQQLSKEDDETLFDKSNNFAYVKNNGKKMFDGFR